MKAPRLGRDPPCLQRRAPFAVVLQQRAPSQLFDASATGAEHVNHHASETIDVLVVGAGPKGPTLANELLRRGVRKRVVLPQSG
jgi:NADPH-dependent 2,4-dienoyl-CoA reductase/sulfur reductase-like enzyme